MNLTQPSSSANGESKRDAALGSTQSAGQRPRLSLRKRIVFTLLTFGFFLVGLVALGEAVLRLVDWPAPGLYYGGRGPVNMKPADELSGPYPPGQGRLRHFDYDVPWRVNRYGFRDREVPAKAPPKYPIGLFGDSMVAGYGVEEDGRFGNQWLRLASNDPHVTLWNLGAAHSGTSHLADVLNGVGQAYELDEVILAVFGGNELSDNLRWEASKSDVNVGHKKESSAASPSRWRIWLRQNSRVATFLWVHGLRGIAHRIQKERSPSPCSVEDMWEYTARALDRFRDAVGDRPLTLWYLPAQYEWDDQWWRSLELDSQTDEVDRFVIRDHVQKWAERNAVPFVDTTPMLLHQAASHVKFPVDPHWNARGHRIVAEGLAAEPNSCWRFRAVARTDSP